MERPGTSRSSSRDVEHAVAARSTAQNRKVIPNAGPSASEASQTLIEAAQDPRYAELVGRVLDHLDEFWGPRGETR